MKVVTTKDELRYALRQKDESIIIKGDLATVMRKALKTSIIISAAFAVATLAVMSFIGWSSSAGQTVRLVIHVAATLVLLIGLVFTCVAKRKGYKCNIKGKDI